MGRYSFVSPGAEAADAITTELLRREAEKQDRLREEFVRSRDDADRKLRADALALERDRENRIAKRQTEIDAEADAERARARSREDNAAGLRQMIGDRLSMGPVSPEDARTIGIMGFREGVSVPSIPGILDMSEPKRTVVQTRDAHGNPVRRAVTEDELIAGVPEYVAPTREPRAPRAEVELPAPIQDYLMSLRTKTDPQTGQRYTLARAEDEISRQWPRLREAHPQLSLPRVRQTLGMLFPRPNQSMFAGLDLDAPMDDGGELDAPAPGGPAVGGGGTRVASMADVQAVAQRAGISEADARRRLEAAGVVIQP